ncbi:MAG: hemerythrin domain-containing protein [Actinomycetota bacterium]|nr:hemerythrin domain-containing protein [Actinomycetota bacterium]
MTEPSSPGVRIQHAIHGAVRRDADRLSSALGSDRAPSPNAVRAFWADMRFQLHHHHEFEDTVVWPLVRRRLGARVDALLDRNADEHEAMGEAMAHFDAVVSAEPLDRAVALAALERMRAAIDLHLAHEEADVLPLLEEGLTPEDFPMLLAASAKDNPPSAFLPWVLDDASDETVAFIGGRLPDAVAAQLAEVWAPHRRTVVDALAVPEPQFVAGLTTSV